MPASDRKTVRNTACLLFGAAFLLFLTYAVPGLLKPELLMRIDSATYLGPARSILDTFEYKSSPASQHLTALRVPLYPAFLAFCLLIGCNSLVFCVVMNCLVSALAVPVVYLAAREFSEKEGPSVLAAILLMLMPTEIAFAPMFLSEGLFVTLTASALFFFQRYANRKTAGDLSLTALIAGLAVLTRPLNILWIFPCLFVTCFIPGIDWKKTVLRGGLALLVFLLTVLPWVVRNHSIGSGWRIDEVSADSLRHNAAVVESRVNNLPAQYYRDRYALFFEKKFADKTEYPDRDACLTFEEKYLTGILMRHKLVYFSLFFNPVKLVPDVPTFLENLSLSIGGRGTWDVIIKDGLFAGILHYFHGRLYLPFLFFPLILLQFLVYCGALGGVICGIFEKKWLIPLFFLLFCVYYLIVVGPGGYPRFQLPALPFLCVLAADFFNRMYECYREKKS